MPRAELTLSSEPGQPKFVKNLNQNEMTVLIKDKLSNWKGLVEYFAELFID